jgi:diguanylate cyclase (GGDEF)-like protein
MTGQARSTRDARGHIVVVGQPPTTDELPQGVIHAENLFEAVGEVTVATAAEPVSAVVVPASLIRGSETLAAEAFRRIDPSVRLILISTGDTQTGANGFDEVVPAPLTAAALVRAMTDDEPAAAETPIETAAETPEPVSVPTPSELPVELMAAPAPDPTAAPDGEPLGDTDLVEAILTRHEGLRELALELIIEQTKWTDLVLTDDAAPDDGVASAEVTFGKRSFGSLTSTQARQRQLRPWAAWLARWLALDHGYRDFRTMAYQDELTGAWNRRFYEVFMKQILQRAARNRRAVTVLVFDIDDFKRYNDEFGHEAGDEVLRETVRLLKSVIRAGDRVCRIGGDEFVVIFADPEGPREPGSNPPETVEAIAGRFQDQICRMKFPKLGLDAPGTLSISGGLSTYPWDGVDAESLLHHADQLALQSKKKGKNVITFGPGSRRG